MRKKLIYRLLPIIAVMCLAGFIFIDAALKVGLKVAAGGEDAAYQSSGPLPLVRPEGPYRDDTPITPAISAYDAVLGKGRVPVVLFCDHISEDCREASQVVRSVYEKSEDSMQVVWKDFPLPMVPGARAAAVAARCAQEQGKFWEFHDLLNQGSRLKAEDFTIVVRSLGLNVERFEACIGESASVAMVNQGMAEAQKLEIDVLPTIFIGPYRIAGKPGIGEVERLVALVEGNR